MLFFGLLAKWTLLEKGIAWLNVGWGSLVAQAGLAGLLPLVGVLTLGLVGAASLLGLDHRFHGNESDNSEAGRTGGPMKRRFRAKNLPMLLVLLLSVGCDRFDETWWASSNIVHRTGSADRRSLRPVRLNSLRTNRTFCTSLLAVILSSRKRRGSPRADSRSSLAPMGLTRSYTYRGEPRPFDNEARAWFGELLQGLIRDGGYGAPGKSATDLAAPRPGRGSGRDFAHQT